VLTTAVPDFRRATCFPRPPARAPTFRLHWNRYRNRNRKPPCAIRAERCGTARPFRFTLDASRSTFYAPWFASDEPRGRGRGRERERRTGPGFWRIDWQSAASGFTPEKSSTRTHTRARSGVSGRPWDVKAFTCAFMWLVEGKTRSVGLWAAMRKGAVVSASRVLRTRNLSGISGRPWSVHVRVRVQRATWRVQVRVAQIKMPWIEV
jgi:hypothetical protein